MRRRGGGRGPHQGLAAARAEASGRRLGRGGEVEDGCRQRCGHRGRPGLVGRAPGSLLAAARAVVHSAGAVRPPWRAQLEHQHARRPALDQPRCGRARRPLRGVGRPLACEDPPSGLARGPESGVAQLRPHAPGPPWWALRRRGLPRERERPRRHRPCGRFASRGAPRLAAHRHRGRHSGQRDPRRGGGHPRDAAIGLAPR
mmetsp:Transcript_8426/g.24107  ORF Transcript_8426/g.24107 Transcript_8426/m.24107 type:complete len:201 (+) Transcript_8426:390-992(+)